MEMLDCLLPEKQSTTSVANARYMDPATPTITASTSQGVPTVGFDIFSFILNIFGGNETTASFFSTNGFVSFLSAAWSVFAVFSLLVSVIMLILYVFASIRRWQFYQLSDISLREAEDLYDAKYRGINKHSRMDDILKHSTSDNPNDWKLAIIEADIILEGILKERGYVGNSLGERLKSIPPSQLSTLNDAWEAHKIRNMIAHEGADFVLTHRMAEETVNRYRRVFGEFGIL